MSKSDANLVHFGDLIDVDVIGSFEYDWRGTLTPEGFLDGLDKIEKQIYALCKSEDDLAAEIAVEYGKALRNPNVAVKILDRSNRAVAFLDGAVKFPQRFQIRRAVFLNELLIVAGGITDSSSGEIQIFRPDNLNCETRIEVKAGEPLRAGQGNGSSTMLIKIVDLLSGRKEANPQVFSGDIITVLDASPIYMIGGVNVPKQISSRSQMTLTRAIATAGGLAKEGVEDKITIFRRDGKQSRVIEADLRKIRSNLAEDPILQAFDIVEVAQKGRESRKFPPIVEVRRISGDKLAKLPLRIIE